MIARPAGANLMRINGPGADVRSMHASVPSLALLGEPTMSTLHADINGVGKLTNNLRHMVDEADHFLKSAARDGDEKFDILRDKFVDQLKHIRLQLDDLEDSAAHKARHAARAADHAVHDNPYAAIGLAAAVGLVVGFMAQRR
jgi:ElaB/YqjD/DUF883 family membrane-anchored ribosome-binding protein